MVAANGITLVLGTGFLKCAAAIGAVEVLRRENIPIRAVVGSSTGSVFAAAVALGYSAEQMRTLFTGLIEAQKPQQMRPRRFLKMALPRLFGFDHRFGLLRDERYMSILKEHFGMKAFDNVQIPLTLVATNLVNGEKVILNRGAIWQAVRASSGMAGLFPAFSLNGQYLVDGAVCDPLPTSQAIQEGAEVIITVGFENPYVEQFQSATDLIYQINSIYLKHLMNTQSTLSTLTHHNEIIPIHPQFGVFIGMDDAHQIPYIIEKGMESAQSVVPYLKSLLTA